MAKYKTKANTGPSTTELAKCASSFAQDDNVSLVFIKLLTY